jgi:hypothetical protein
MAKYELSYGERLAKLEQSENDMRADIDEIKRDVKTLVAGWAAMTGGKKAMIIFFTMLGTAVGMFVGIISAVIAITHK